jgi:nucleoid-associated protein YgaU
MLVSANVRLRMKETSMGLLSFIKDAGEKLIEKVTGSSSAQAATPENQQKVEQEILNYIASQQLSATGLMVSVDLAAHKASVFGVAESQHIKEKILLCVGNVAGIEHVEDNMSVKVQATTPPSVWHDVVKGDTLWEVAQKHYNNGQRYTEIFEANRPMLSHPDKIYVGQKLRIPQG